VNELRIISVMIFTVACELSGHRASANNIDPVVQWPRDCPPRCILKPQVVPQLPLFASPSGVEVPLPNYIPPVGGAPGLYYYIPPAGGAPQFYYSVPPPIGGAPQYPLPSGDPADSEEESH
jgi:hypothetical protein